LPIYQRYPGRFDQNPHRALSLERSATSLRGYGGQDADISSIEGFGPIGKLNQENMSKIDRALAFFLQLDQIVTRSASDTQTGEQQ
jgi:hypothetical protein